MLNRGKREQRVVIVDDSRTTRAVLEAVLDASTAFRVVGVASDAPSAAKMVADLKPDLVTIDLCMPYIDGAGLLAMLAGQNDVCKVVISDHAASSMAMVTRLRNAGAATCIAKRDIAADPAAFVRTMQGIAASFRRPGALPRSVPSDHEGALRAMPYRGLRRALPFGYPIPKDEAERLDYLARKHLANAERERQFDLITGHVAQLSTFPMCLMTFIDRDTQWLKSAYGLAGSSTPRCEAFCNYTIAQDDCFVVRNAANDPAFATNPLVTGDPQIRTYVGHPIVTQEGIHAGALCVIDKKVRLVTDTLKAELKGMAEIAAETLNRRPLLAA
ncbi:response regulator [uncultured Sphingomonas sp.]|uniref:response regulator n=1 Tax=uncultured Sphingomonas sp. TaxID=158754 RepID=UPI0035CA062C